MDLCVFALTNRRETYGNFRKRIMKQKKTDKLKNPERKTELIIERNFYLSPEWMSLRYDVLKNSNRTCELCGACGKGVKLHVDHIRPRSRFPEFSLELSNLQVLCEPCNLGKSDKDLIDWRRGSSKWDRRPDPNKPGKSWVHQRACLGK